MPTRSWLNRCHSKRVPFHWTINPYRGCEYGCKYCYARFTHEFMERRDPEAFETQIFAKEWTPQEFQRELRSVQPGQTIGIGTATDPYQPAERKYRLTNQVLQALLPASGLRFFLTTKSDLVSRDADLLAQIARQNEVRVSVTVTTMDPRLARITEPYAPRPDLRLAAVAQLANAGISVGVIASPILPLITDQEASLLAVAHAAAKSGATSFGAGVLFLKPSAKLTFFPFLAKHFPEYLERYERNYSEYAYLRNEYANNISRRVGRVRAAANLPARDLVFSAKPALPSVQNAQLRLF